MPRESTRTVTCNDLAIKKLIKAQTGEKPADWRIKATKGGTSIPGFILRTQPSGTAAFYLYYRNDLRRKRKYKLADHGAVALASVTEKAKQTVDRVSSGEDPAADKAANREAMTFRQLAELFLAEGDLRPRTAEGYGRMYAANVFPAFGDKPIDKVTDDDVRGVCAKIASRGSRTQADRTRAAIGGAYRWGRKFNLTKNRPARDVEKHSKPNPRRRTPTDAELKALWQGLDSGVVPMSEAIRKICKLTVLTGQRRSEVAGARISELTDLDGDNPMWVIPGDTLKRGNSKGGKVVRGRTKNRIEQSVPLSPYAAQLFREAIAEIEDLKLTTAETRKCVFPADLRRAKTGDATREPHIHGDSATHSFVKLRDKVGVSDITLHDMRRAISTYLKNNDFSKDVRDLVLNHKDGSVTGEHYESTARMENQVRAAFAAWESHVLKVVGVRSSEGGNVVSLRA